MEHIWSPLLTTAPPLWEPLGMALSPPAEWSQREGEQEGEMTDSDILFLFLLTNVLIVIRFGSKCLLNALNV